MVSTCPLFPSPLVTVLSAPILIGTIFFSSSLARSRYLFLSVFFQFYLWSDGKVHYSAGSFFCWLSIGLVVQPRFDADLFVSQISKSQRILCISFSRMVSGLCIYYVCMVKFQFLAPFSVDHISYPVLSRLILFCANLLYSLMRLIILSNHHIIYIYCFVASCFDIVLMVLFCAAIRRDSVSLLSYPFLSHVQIFLCKISLVYRWKCLYSCFSYHFCFIVIFVLLMLVLSVLFLAAVISLPLHIFYVVI